MQKPRMDTQTRKDGSCCRNCRFGHFQNVWKITWVCWHDGHSTQTIVQVHVLERRRSHVNMIVSIERQQHVLDTARLFDCVCGRWTTSLVDAGMWLQPSQWIYRINCCFEDGTHSCRDWMPLDERITFGFCQVNKLINYNFWLLAPRDRCVVAFERMSCVFFCNHVDSFKYLH